MDKISEDMIGVIKTIDNAKFYWDGEDNTCIYCKGNIKARDTYQDFHDGRWGEIITENHAPDCVIMVARKLVEEIENADRY